MGYVGMIVGLSLVFTLTACDPSASSAIADLEDRIVRLEVVSDQVLDAEFDRVLEAWLKLLGRSEDDKLVSQHFARDLSLIQTTDDPPIILGDLMDNSQVIATYGFHVSGVDGMLAQIVEDRTRMTWKPQGGRFADVSKLNLGSAGEITRHDD